MAQRRPVKDVIIARGHPNISASNRRTLEITKDPYVTRRGDCIIACCADKAGPELAGDLLEALMRPGTVRIVVEAGAINVTLRGCTNESITVIANTSLALQFNRECPLYINASAYTLSSQSISYWDALNVWLGNVVSYYDGEPLILNGTVEVYATFLNGSRVPAPVLVNGSSTYILQSPGPSSLLLSINYLGVVNESLVRVFVVPSTYVEAEELLNSLGNPQFLNATIASAITSGDWSLVNKIVTEYQEASSRPYDPLTQLSKYLLTQAILNGNLNGLNAASLILKYEMLMYTVLASIIIAVVVAYRVTRKSRKS